MKIQQLADGRWKADFYLGPQRRRLIDANRKRLEDKVQRAQRDHHEQTVLGVPAANHSHLTFKEACERHYKLYCVPNQQKDAWGFLERLMGYFGEDVRLTSISPERIKEWRADWLGEGKALATIKRHYNTLCALMREMTADGKLATNPCVGLFKKQWKGIHNPRQRWFTDEETQISYAACFDKDMCHYAVVARNTGFRENNITELDWQDVVWVNGVVWARRVKTGKPYCLKMNAAVLGVLTGRWEEQGRPSVGRVFGAPKSAEYWSNRFITMFQGLGWHTPELTMQQRATLHTYRHTFCSQLVMAGYNDRTIMAAMGWTSADQLKTYAHLAPDYMAKALESIELGVGVGV